MFTTGRGRAGGAAMARERGARPRARVRYPLIWRAVRRLDVGKTKDLTQSRKNLLPTDLNQI